MSLGVYSVSLVSWRPGCDDLLMQELQMSVGVGVFSMHYNFPS